MWVGGGSNLPKKKHYVTLEWPLCVLEYNCVWIQMCVCACEHACVCVCDFNDFNRGV